MKLNFNLKLTMTGIATLLTAMFFIQVSGFGIGVMEVVGLVLGMVGILLSVLGLTDRPEDQPTKVQQKNDDQQTDKE